MNLTATPPHVRSLIDAASTSGLDPVRAFVAHLDFTHRHLGLAIGVAIGVFVVLQVLRRKHHHIEHALTGALAGAGFLVAPLLGVVTLCSAIGYHAATAGRGGFRTRRFIGWGAATFAALVAVYVWAAPAWWTATKAHASALAPRLLIALVALLLLSFAVRWFLHRHDHGLGPQNHQVPMEERDPQRDANAAQTLEVLENYDNTCAIPRCGARTGMPGVTLQMDHIHPWDSGGPTVVENLQPLCQPHNGGKGTKSMDEYLAYLAAKGRL